ncbi:hypothetical protein HU200_043094 [Digitaria exilis]|uniref:Transposase MuDR plant domain-containing protein n=1 Tax=Digitaria exilis TaxID=1010633 RepID=A0A835BA63_9POAL|nr:hypothetical protein HU200_043094 [Digitaria exilis]
MDGLDNLAIRFHFGGAFVGSGRQLKYVGGRTTISHVELDRLSLPEIKGHLADHVIPSDVTRLHWLGPGYNLCDGLMLLVDDLSCKFMADHIIDGGVAELYVEDVAMESNALEETNAWTGDADYEWAEMAQSPKSPNIADEEAQDSESSDEEYQQPFDEDSSAEDEEAHEMRKFAKEIKMNIKAKKIGVHGSQVGKITPEALFAEGCNLEDEGEHYIDSSEDYSYEDNSEGETERWKSMENRYDSKAAVPVFSLGMAFRSSRHFKKALIKYGLTTHRHLKFPKDEKNRVRVNCSWPGCKWLIYGSKTSRSEWFKVVTFIDEHSCPPRRDNKLVTSIRIAKRYFHEIKDNPTWKVELIKKAVLKDMLADVTIAKCKRAKGLVLKAALDSMKGEYSKVYDYRMELLRSNPGSTVVVCLNPEIREHNVFERFYVCFDACKKGFLAGCRRVIGLDGCWFKGATNGELLCAIGRDANNQMYPIARAAVEKETNDSWYWFLGLLQKDLNITGGGEGWVIISDQQKVITSDQLQLIYILSMFCLN